jgi:hypothetical protein
MIHGTASAGAAGTWLAELEGMNQTMRTVLGTALLVGVGVAAWSRRSPSPRRDAAPTPPGPRRSPTPAVRRRAVGTAPPVHVRDSRAAEPQEIDGWVTAAITGHNPGLAARAAPDVEALGVRGAGLASYGPSHGDVSEIYGQVIAPGAEADSELEPSPVPGNLSPDGQTWTETLMSSSAEDGRVPEDPYAEVRIIRGRDDDDDVPVADRGSGGVGGL